MGKKWKKKKKKKEKKIVPIPHKKSSSPLIPNSTDFQSNLICFPLGSFLNCKSTVFLALLVKREARKTWPKLVIHQLPSRACLLLELVEFVKTLLLELLLKLAFFLSLFSSHCFFFLSLIKPILDELEYSLIRTNYCQIQFDGLC